MTDESTSLTELARETYGTEFHGDPRDELVRSDGRAASLSMENDLDRLQSEEQETDSHAPPPADRSSYESAPSSSSVDAIWSTEDAQTIAQFQQEYQQLSADIQAYANAKAAVDLDQLDKGEAEANRQQMKQVEDELRQRHEGLMRVRDQLATRVQEHQREQLQRILAEEQRKLEKALPDLDKEALADYLRSTGFTDHDIENAADSRLLILAEKARRYDDLMAKGEPAKTPKKRKGASNESKSNSNVASLDARFRETGRLHDALELLRAQKKGAA